MRYAPNPTPLPLNDRQPAIGPDGPELFPAAGPAVADFLIAEIFHPFACDAGIVIDGPKLRCGRYSELRSQIKWASENTHFLLPQLNHHSCCKPGYGGFVARNVFDADEREWLSVCCRDPTAVIEVLPGRFQYLYAIHPLVEPKLFRQLDEALIGREGFPHGAGLLILPSGTLAGFRVRLVEFAGATFTLDELILELGLPANLLARSGGRK
jgi:hypothetical protein